MKPYYEADGVVIYHGDCREVLPSLDVRADLVLTDPPYSDQTHTGARTGGIKKTKALVTFAHMTDADLAESFAAIARVAARWVLATVDWKHAALLEREPPTGLRFVRCGVWVKEAPMPQLTGDRPAQGWEAVALLHANTAGRMRWAGGGSPAVWTHLPERAVNYPTAKPVSLVAKWVRLFADPGGLVLDPFMGSGTTLVAAKNLGHPAIGIDVSERACEVAAKRLSQRVLDFGGEAA